MNVTYQQAVNAAKIIRQYQSGEKKCTHYISKEADEISACDYILQEWTHNYSDEFRPEWEWSHTVCVSNYHKEEVAVFGDC